MNHLSKCLSRAAQLHRALDRPMTGVDAPPSTLSISLSLGDVEPTPAVLAVNPRTGRVSVKEFAPGDGTVTRASALMDERVGGAFTPRLSTPIRWDKVQFVPADHLGLTEHDSFVDGLLYTLLEQPRASQNRREAGDHGTPRASN